VCPTGWPEITWSRAASGLFILVSLKDPLVYHHSPCREKSAFPAPKSITGVVVGFLEATGNHDPGNARLVIFPAVEYSGKQGVSWDDAS
jgi:hypothetical protein